MTGQPARTMRRRRIGHLPHSAARARSGARGARRRMNLVNLESVSLSYGVRPLLDDVSLGIADRELPVAYVGGTFRAGELLLAPLRDTIKRELPQAVVNRPLRKPVEGAAMMAIRAAAHPRPSRTPA